jgi:DNA repair exonuclease SbcCD ATPase subunit
MRILKLRVTNFIPYFGEDNEIVLWDEDRPGKNATLDIGPTGNGKTSISRAVMFCLFGEQFAPEWESMINDLALDLGKQSPKRPVKIAVEMEVDIEGDTYVILRVGEYDLGIGKRAEDTKLFVRLNGEPIKGEPEDFINDKFPPVGLMEYFIFDADDMLALFEKNREKTIKDHINKIVGVETLDSMSDSLGDVITLYESQINDVRNKSPGVSREALNQEISKKSAKILSIRQQEAEIQNLERKKKDLFPKGRLSAEETRLKEVMDRQQAAEEEMAELDKSLTGNKELVSNFHMLFLKEIINKSVQIVNKKETTKTEFDGAIGTLRSTIEGKYGGVIFDEEDAFLVRRGAQIKEGQREGLEKLKLGQGSGIKAIALREFADAQRIEGQTESEFLSLETKFKDAQNRLSQARNLLRQMGEKEKNAKLKERIEKFLGYDKEIFERKHVLEETKAQLAKIEDEINELSKDQKTTAEVDRKIKKIHEKAELAAYMKKVTEETKKSFLQQLLRDVNLNATEFFRGVIRGDDPRLDSISVDSDYRLNVKDKDGKSIDPETISKGNKQISLMAFFFGISKYLKNKLPYIIDDPLIRLDAGHDKRLVTQLCKSDQQLVMHMIPGKEYTKDSFDWLRPYINTQNWINRTREKGPSLERLKSYAKKMDPNSFVEYNIDKL